MALDLGPADAGVGAEIRGQALTFALVRMVRESILNTD
jgi:hypothetical protein